MVCITSKVDGYRRCGVLHPASPTEHPDDRFGAEELALLRSDPLLTVEVATSPEGVAGHLDPEGLEDMTVAQLNKLAAAMGLELPDRATKRQLIGLISKQEVLVNDDGMTEAQ